MAIRVARSERKPTTRDARSLSTLRVASLHGLCGDLQASRSDRDLKLLESVRGSALVFPFAKGLRLSSQLIYILRKQLSELEHVEVNWGQVVGGDEKAFSPECDIIIHHHGCVEKWNGTEKPVMDFRFVPQRCALAVISCKSFAERVDREYVKKLQPFVPHIFFFAECCEPRKVDPLRRAAEKSGYAGFGYLYTMEKAKGVTTKDPEQWIRFLDRVISIVKKEAKVKRECDANG